MCWESWTRDLARRLWVWYACLGPPGIKCFGDVGIWIARMEWCMSFATDREIGPLEWLKERETIMDKQM